jgi:hypothetical protein
VCTRAEDAFRVRTKLEELAYLGHLVERCGSEPFFFVQSGYSHDVFAEAIRTCIKWSHYDSVLILRVTDFAAIGTPYVDLDDFVTTFGDKWQAELVS